MEESRLMLWSIFTIFIITAIVVWSVNTEPITWSTDASGMAVWSRVELLRNNYQPVAGQHYDGVTNTACIQDGILYTLPRKRIAKLCGDNAYVINTGYSASKGCLLHLTDTQVGVIDKYFRLLEPYTFGKHTYTIVSELYGVCKLRVSTP